MKEFFPLNPCFNDVCYTKHTMLLRRGLCNVVALVANYISLCTEIKDFLFYYFLFKSSIVLFSTHCQHIEAFVFTKPQQS